MWNALASSACLNGLTQGDLLGWSLGVFMLGVAVGGIVSRPAPAPTERE